MGLKPANLCKPMARVTTRLTAPRNLDNINPPIKVTYSVDDEKVISTIKY